MALSLQSLLPPTRSGRTFYAAAGLLGLGALVQLLVMAIFLLRGGVVWHPPPPTFSFAETVQPAVSTIDTPAAAQTTVPAPVPASPANAGEALAPLPGTSASPTPAPAVPAENSVAGLVEQARQLRQRGDMPSALARLREAQVAEPENPQIIAEMAVTYEKMQLSDRAFEQWQRLYNMGESVGALFNLADSRLHAAPAGAPAAPPANAPGTVVGFANSATTDQESTVLKITDIHLDEVPDPVAEKKLVLKIVVKDRPGSAIDPTKVRILTYFYDQIDGNDIVLTDAQTAYAWVTQAPINWAGDKSEVLETTYLRPKAAPAAATPAPPDATPAAARGSHRGARGKKPEADAAAPTAAPTPAQVRTFYGYEVRLYYDHQLQDVHADPLRLLQKYIPPSTLAE